MMKYRYKLTYVPVVALLVLLLNACDKNFEEPSTGITGNFTDMQIDENFKFETTKTLEINIEVKSNNPGMLPHIIKIWEAAPDGELKQIKKGMTSPQRNYSSKLTIPSYVEEIYVQSSSANGFNEIVTLKTESAVLNHTFNENKSAEYLKAVTSVDPGCPSGDCDEILSGTENNVKIDDGKVYCITGNLTATNINFKGGTLRVCGNLIASNIQGSGNKGGTLIVSSSGSVQANNVNYNNLDEVYIYGTMAQSGNVTVNGNTDFQNYGTFNCNGLNGQTANFINAGTMNIAGHCNNNESMINEGSMIISGNLSNNGNSTFVNHCQLIVTGHFNQNNLFDNYAYVEVGDNLTLNGSSQTNLHEQSLMATYNFTVNGDLTGPQQSCARVNVQNTTNINGSGNVSNYVNICDENGIENNNGNIGGNVSFDCASCFIPQTSCNPGAGNPPFSDTDGDGVIDDEDDFPNDADRAFISTDFVTLAFEDLWPAMGDYDFNDLVMGCDYQLITNAQNNAVDLIADFHIKAGGAGLDNGFGFSLPVPPSHVESVTGSQIVSSVVNLAPQGYESGHTSNTVVIVYDAINSMLGTAMFNTTPGETYIETDTTRITVHFSTPQTDIGTLPYNPFIFIDGERGKEVHLIDNEPTSFADPQYFGNWDDDSDPSVKRYYVTENNLPWAIQIPDDFDYPVEKADIVQTYLKFAQWAQSGGLVFNDWYLDSPGYRNNSNIYSN